MAFGEETSPDGGAVSESTTNGEETERPAATDAELPCVSFFPALPLAKTIELDDWRIGAVPSGVSWKPKLEAPARALLDSFGEHGCRHPSLVWHATRGVDGSPAPDRECMAMELAVTFAALDTRDGLAGASGDPERVHR